MKKLFITLLVIASFGTQHAEAQQAKKDTIPAKSEVVATETNTEKVYSAKEIEEGESSFEAKIRNEENKRIAEARRKAIQERAERQKISREINRSWDIEYTSFLRWIKDLFFGFIVPIVKFMIALVFFAVLFLMIIAFVIVVYKQSRKAMINTYNYSRINKEGEMKEEFAERVYEQRQMTDEELLERKIYLKKQGKAIRVFFIGLGLLIFLGTLTNNSAVGSVGFLIMAIGAGQFIANWFTYSDGKFNRL